MNGQIEYIRIPIQILQDSNLCDKQKMLLGLIISFSEKGLMMSNGELAKLLGLNTDYVSQLISGLEKKKYISITGTQSKYRKIHFEENLKVEDNSLLENSTPCLEKSRLLLEKPKHTLRNISNKTKGTEKNIKELNLYCPNSVEFELSSLLFNLILERKPDFKQPDLQNWARHIDLMMRIDKRNPINIRFVIEWCQNDTFWQNNILSTDKLRKQFDKLELQMAAGRAGQGNGGVCDLTEERFLELTEGIR